MYKNHFGLNYKPFSITPDPRFLYLSARHREALAHLLYGVSEGGGFVLLTGEVGTGKTTLCRSLLEQLPPQVDLALILNPRLDAVELVAAVCDELQISYPPGCTSLRTLVGALNDHLLQSHATGRRTVLVIDEAQNLSPEVLEQVRLLTNLETSESKLLEITLLGQPELREILARPELRQLAQRITARYHLNPLNLEETVAYVRHRLRVAGVSRPLFTRGALKALARLSGGIPRLINVICDRALLGAYVEERNEVDAAILRRAAREIQNEDNLPQRWRRSLTAPGLRRLLLAALLLLALLPAGLLAYRSLPSTPPVVTTERPEEAVTIAEDLLWPPLMPTELLQEGDRGPEVRQLRLLLTWLAAELPGYDTDAETVAAQAATESEADYFDAGLTRLVSDFQAAHDLQADGMVGPQTLRQLHRSLAELPPPAPATRRDQSSGSH
ncbi:ExeA family protein [Desulfurivibrio dismutans]|uniref:ExeA family protein n=1 Tax=Desulfurivibrio dismutans TaxID=1398908 RepID=UPI0023DCAEF9|nr:AAA family ATPase [Desulfurivibrio alkaliphilus]MDF1614641.1 AAA family ATPase [Desulfurivibrio alkaliphilus]